MKKIMDKELYDFMCRFIINAAYKTTFPKDKLDELKFSFSLLSDNLFISEQRKHVDNIKLTKELVLAFYNITDDIMMTPSKKEDIVIPRQILSFILKHHFEVKTIDISRITGRSERTSAYNSISAVENAITCNDVKYVKGLYIIESILHRKDVISKQHVSADNFESSILKSFNK